MPNWSTQINNTNYIFWLMNYSTLTSLDYLLLGLGWYAICVLCKTVNIVSKVNNFSFLFSDPESRIQTIQHAHSSSYDETSEGGEAGETSSQTSSAKVAAEAGVQRKASTASSSSKASSVASSSGAPQPAAPEPTARWGLKTRLLFSCCQSQLMKCLIKWNSRSG